MAVQLVHLELPLEVGDHPQALDDHLRLPAPRELDHELREDVHLDVLEVGERLLQELDALLEAEERRLVPRAADDADDDAVEDRRGARDHVDVAHRDGVIRSWADGGDHEGGSKRVSRAEPYRREVRIGSGSCGSTLRPGLDDEQPVGREQPRQVLRELRLELAPGLVGRVDEDQVVLTRLPPHCPDGVAARDARAGQLQLREVVGDRPAGGLVALDEGHARRAARERLEPQRARAGEEVEHAGVVDRPDQVERGLADAVARRPGREPLGRRDPRPAVGAGDDPHAGIVLRQADDELHVAVLVAARELIAEPADERERRRVAVRDHRPEAQDSLVAREQAKLREQLLAETPALPLVDDRERDLRLERALVADEPRDPDRPARLLVDRSDRLAPRAADVDELLEVAREQARLGAEKAEAPRALGEAREDFEHGTPVAVAQRPENDRIHVRSVAANTAPTGSAPQPSLVRLPVLRGPIAAPHDSPRCCGLPAAPRPPVPSSPAVARGLRRAPARAARGRA